MSNLPDKATLDNYAQRYLERCKRIQRLANSDPAYKQPATMLQPDNNGSPVIVILDDDDDKNKTPSNNQSLPATSHLRQLLQFRRPPHQNIEKTLPPKRPETTDLHITGVGILKEWIDISELDAKKQEQRNSTQTSYRPEEKRRKRNEDDVQIVENSSLLRKRLETRIDDEVEVVAVINANWADVNVEEDLEDEVVEIVAQPKAEKNPKHSTLEPKEKPSNNDAESQLPPEASQLTLEQNGKSHEDTQNLEQNQQKDHDTPYFKCEHCPYSTSWKSNLNKHVVSRHKSLEEIRWFECDHCPYKGKTREYLRSHIRQNHDVTWLQCPKCPLKFKMPQALKHHKISIHTAPEEIQWLQCDQCDFKCKFKPTLKQHHIFKHTADSEINWFQCKLCPYKGKSRRGLRKHQINMYHDTGEIALLECDKCDFDCFSKKALTRHMHNYHPDGAEEVENDISETVLECKQCGIKMMSKAKFREHFGWNNGRTCYF